MDLIKFHVDGTEDERLDSYLASRIENLSRNYIQGLIKEGLVLVNDQGCKARYKG